MSRDLRSKLCVTCGRVMTWRKKWEKNWDEVRYCSDACRRRRSTDTDRALEAAILQLLAARAAGASICPSEAARRVGGAEWEPLMPAVRDAGRRLASKHQIEITQGGRVVDGSRAAGPIRYRIPRQKRAGTAAAKQ